MPVPWQCSFPSRSICHGWGNTSPSPHRTSYNKSHTEPPFGRLFCYENMAFALTTGQGPSVMLSMEGSISSTSHMSYSMEAKTWHTTNLQRVCPSLWWQRANKLTRLTTTTTAEHEHDKHEPKGAWFGLRVGLLIGGMAGTLIGGMVGSVAMLLLAPHSGKKTRAKLLRQGKELREQAAESAEDAMDEAGVKAHQITHDVRRQAKKMERRGHAMLDGQNGH